MDALVDVPAAQRTVFDDLVAEYDRSVPFQRRGQCERHRQTIDDPRSP
jgi:hypothetical protein